MPTIIDNMEKEALSFMAKRKKIEEKRKEEMLKKNNQMFRELITVLNSAEQVSISFLPSFIQNELKPIVDKYKNEQNIYVDSFIRDDYEVGIQTGHKLLSLANENITIDNGEIANSEYEEVLIALLLYAERIIDSQYNDLLGNLNKNITSVYILNKNASDRNVNKEIKTDKSSTLNTILSGAILSKYINQSFKNINIRTDMTAQNETNRALNHGILMRYILARRYTFSGLAVKWVEVRDERLCQYCRDASEGGDFGNGVYDITDITPPPLHSRCRCILVPFLSRWGEEIG